MPQGNDMDIAYTNADFIPGGANYPARWATAAQAFRAGLGDRARLGLRYGGGNAQWFDMFLPEGGAKGVMVFIHGGYWLRFGPRDFSHLAAGAVMRGWAVAMPAYTLAPECRIGAMTAEIASAIGVIAGGFGGPIAIAGHSAGGHLAARMACADAALSPEVADRIVRILPVSPLTDLHPLMGTSMNAVLGIDGTEAMAESPALLPRRKGCEVHVWVGGAERPVFLDHARWLGKAWDCPVTVMQDRHHFDIIEPLEWEGSDMLAVLLA